MTDTNQTASAENTTGCECGCGTETQMAEMMKNCCGEGVDGFDCKDMMEKMFTGKKEENAKQE